MSCRRADISEPASTYIGFTTSSDASTCTDYKRADTALHG
jgi:hypothetical protein